MGSLGTSKNGDSCKHHVVCIPYPAQGHINPMLKLAKLLNVQGFHITFVNTEFNHSRLLRSRGPRALDGLPTFRFETIPDGLPPTHADATQDIPSLCESTRKNCLEPFRKLLRRINDESAAGAPGAPPPVSCVLSDGVMTFTADAAEELGVPEVMFWTTSACGFLAYLQFQRLIDEGFTPLKDESCLTNGYLDDTIIEWIPAMKSMRLKDIPSFIRTTNPDDIMLDFILSETARAQRASAILLNTFEALEHEVLKALSSIVPPVYTIGPLNLLNGILIPESHQLNQLSSSLWKEDTKCLEWLDSQEQNSVVYVNFGSITVMTSDELIEFAWGLANTGKPFLWVIRPDLVAGDTAVLPPEFLSEIENRGVLSTWCPQDKVLQHPSVGVFLTHCGWNSTLESLCGGVPVICWPFFAEQQTNRRFCTVEWGVGMEIDAKEGTRPTRERIESVVREVMEGERGKMMREKAEEWQRKAEEAAKGSSLENLEKVMRDVMLKTREH